MTARTFAIDVTQKLQVAGFQALWAGGCVRDQLLGKAPKDYDVATSATPQQIRELFGFGRTLPLGAAFGVITVIGPKNAGNIEIATFRTDAGYSDGRHPDSVEFSTAEMDAQRRDFTINGLFFDPSTGQVIDYVGGREDLKQRVIRAIGDPSKRIAEDKLRMLRATRFAANLDFQLDPDTADTIRHHAAEIDKVSAERIASELQRMLVHENRDRSLQLLIDTCLIQEIIPEFCDVIRNPARLSITDARLRQLDRPSFAVALVTLLFEHSDHSVFERTCKRLKLPNEVRDSGKWILEVESQVEQAHQLPWSQIQPILIASHVDQAIQFVDANLKAQNSSGEAIEFCRNSLELPIEELNPAALLNGNQLLKQGFQPGPDFSKILQETRRAQLDGEIHSTREALEIARKLIQVDRFQSGSD